MAENSGIGWTDHTYNPWVGCNKVCPECVRVPFNGPMQTKNWTNPLKWNRRAILDGTRLKIFTYSMSGADPWRDEAWRLIRDCTALDWLILNKRPELIADRLPSDWGNGYPKVWLGVTCGIS